MLELQVSEGLIYSKTITILVGAEREDIETL